MTQVKLLYIHAYRHRFGVEPICALLSEHGMTIAPQTYYKWLPTNSLVGRDHKTGNSRGRGLLVDAGQSSDRVVSRS